MAIRDILIITPTGIRCGRTSVIRSLIIMVPHIPATAHALTTANIVTITLTIATKADRKLLVSPLKIGTFFVSCGNRQTGPFRIIIKEEKSAIS